MKRCSEGHPMPEHTPTGRQMACGCYEGVHIESGGTPTTTAIYIGGADITENVVSVGWRCKVGELASAVVEFEHVSVIVTGQMDATSGFVTDLVGCARCHGDGHERLTFALLDHPVPADDGSEPYTHWATCPSNGQPILMRSIKVERDATDHESSQAAPHQG